MLPTDSSRLSPTYENDVVVGFGEILTEIMERLVGHQSRRQIIALVGMGGIAKTTLAQNVYVNRLIVQYFDICAWVTVSQEYNHNLDNLQGISTQRRIIVPRSTLKKKYLPQLLNGLQSAPLARSFICDFEGNLPWHTCRLMRHTCRLMRVLKMADKYLRSRKERNYKYSLEDIFQLVNSRYLAVNANLNLNSAFPSSMYLLWNLQTLIVKGTGRRQAIGLFESWKMPQLRHVEFVKLYLPDPPSGQESGEDNFVLRNLQTLLNIGDFKCDEEVVKRIPNLTLSGSRLQWDDMAKMEGSLPHLQVLKLEEESCQGPEWELVEGQFCSLKFLLIDSYNHLEYWRADNTHFPCLEQLVLRNLDKLKEIPSDIGEIPTPRSIQLEYCGNSTVISAKEIVDEQEELGNLDLQVRVIFSEENELMESLATPSFQIEIRAWRVLPERSLKSYSLVKRRARKTKQSNTDV
ncbi:hypothetical protein BUALT_Bualt07G0065200 [Buddleja alternifolia]|uniref:NB-ARC domain-containing protein n=1 Tax=Buddleja alternifolia TaxID=168488 RepID=A0AAV6X9X2_9LAMI|nr:hypothetical protein BUALT_Bualt07G0065200 [Buddleja alternifolia]